MNSLSLYTLSSQVEQILNSPDAIDLETGELSCALVDALALTKDKGASVCAYILNQDSLITAIEAHEAQVSARKEAIVKKQMKLREYLATSMKRSGVHEIHANDGTFSAKLFIERDASVEIMDEKLVPLNYFAKPKPPVVKPDKKLIASALKAGADVPGARIVKRDRLEIS